MKLNDVQKRELLELLSALVEFKSINPPGDELEISEFIFDYLKCNGLSPVYVPTENPCRKNIVAEVRGKNEESVVFTGHMDVVPVSSSEMLRWRTDPFKAVIEDGRLYGRGSSDMKSGVAAMIYALITLIKEGIVPEKTVILAITCDEENAMTGSKSLIKTNLFSRASSVVVCEPTGLRLCRVGKGRTYANVFVRGKTAHGSYQGQGQNAIDIAVALIERMRTVDFSEYEHPKYGGSFWRPLAINACVEPQVVPDEARLLVDARLSVLHDPIEVWREFDRIIGEVTAEFPGSAIEYEVCDLRKPFMTKLYRPIVKKIYNAAEKTGIKLTEDHFTGTTDGTQFAKIGLSPVILGPGDLTCVHRENENVELEQVYKACELYENIMI